MAIRAERGTRDVLPREIAHWQHLEDQARRLADDYGYREIRTPMFESVDLFLQGMGASAGVVERELWTFHDKHGKKLALRADLTAPVVRAWHEHGLEGDTGPAKLFYLGPVFLHGREREVESRQVHQFGLEALGSPDAALDAEVIVLATDWCAAVGLEDVRLQLNSLGCKKCRPAYHQSLKDYFGGRQDELCKTCKRRYRSHPLWTLGCEAESCLELSRVAPSIYGHLCADCRAHFNSLKAYLKEVRVDFQLNPLVVRDLEYYDRTIFQITAGGRMVGYGGRYDELAAVLTGSSAPAVGCSLDLEAVLDALHEVGVDLPDPEPPQVCLAGQGPEAVALLLPVLYALRRGGIRAELAYPAHPEEPAAEAAARSKAGLVVLLDEEDVRRRVVTFSDGDKGRSQQVRLEEAVSRIGRLFDLEDLADELRPVEVRRLPVSRRRRPGGRTGGRSRALYGSDTARPEKVKTRTKKARAEEAEEAEGEGRGRKRRRRARRKGGAEEAVAVAAETAAPAGEERSEGGRKRRRRRSRRGRGERAAEVAEAPERRDDRGEDSGPSRGRGRTEEPREGSRRRRGRRRAEEDDSERSGGRPEEEARRSEDSGRSRSRRSREDEDRGRGRSDEEDDRSRRRSDEEDDRGFRRSDDEDRGRRRSEDDDDRGRRRSEADDDRGYRRSDEDDDRGRRRSDDDDDRGRRRSDDDDDRGRRRSDDDDRGRRRSDDDDDRGRRRSDPDDDRGRGRYDEDDDRGRRRSEEDDGDRGRRRAEVDEQDSGRSRRRRRSGDEPARGRGGRTTGEAASQAETRGGEERGREEAEDAEPGEAGNGRGRRRRRGRGRGSGGAAEDSPGSEPRPEAAPKEAPEASRNGTGSSGGRSSRRRPARRGGKGEAAGREEEP